MSLKTKILIELSCFIALLLFMVLDDIHESYYFQEFDSTEDLIQKSLRENKPNNVVLSDVVDRDNRSDYWAILTVDTFIHDTAIIYTGCKYYWIFNTQTGQIIEQPSLG